jgi:molecular chaperone DnaJ
MAGKDYYSILGVNKDASEAEIKSAYRKLAREHHPDVAKNKEEAEKKFKEINEAYQVLGDKNKKAQYDQFGSAGFNGGSAGGNPFGGGGNGYTYTWNSSGGGNPFGGADPFDIFEEVFGFRGFGGGNRAPQKGKNLYYQISISFVDSIKGTTKKIRVGKEEFDVKIPAGVNTGTELKLAGKGGEAPSKDLPNGDLFLAIVVEEVENFERHGADIYSIQPIKLTVAVLGAKVKVKTVDPKSSSALGEVTLKIPAGTQEGTLFRIKESGVPRLRGGGRGDHFVKVTLVTPTKITKKQKKLLEELEKEGL